VAGEVILQAHGHDVVKGMVQSIQHVNRRRVVRMRPRAQ